MDKPANASREEASRVRWLVFLLFLPQLLYYFHQAAVIRIDYSDTFQTLNNMKALLGFDTIFSHIRPSFAGVVLLPGILLDEYLPLFNNRLFWIKGINVLLVFSLYWVTGRLFAQVFSWPLALLGVLLMSLNRLFLHYTPFAMSDLMLTLWTVLTCWFYLRGRQEGGGPHNFYWVAYFLATGMLTKYVFALYILPTLLLFEVGIWVRDKKRPEILMNPHWWLMWLSAAAGLALVSLGIYLQQFGWHDALPMLNKTLWHQFSAAGLTHSGYAQESKWEYLTALAASMSPPLLVLMLAGMGLWLWRRTPGGWLFFCLLAVIFSVSTWLLQHKESRYLLPLYPAAYFFVIFALEQLILWLKNHPQVSPPFRRLFWGSLGAMLGISVLWTAAQEVSLMRDPAYHTPLMQQAGLGLRPDKVPGQVFWLGDYYGIYPDAPPLHPGDEFYNLYHLSPFALSYFAHRQDIAWIEPQSVQAAAGDVLFVFEGPVLKRIRVQKPQSEVHEWFPPRWAD